MPLPVDALKDADMMGETENLEEGYVVDTGQECVISAMAK